MIQIYKNLGGKMKFELCTVVSSRNCHRAWYFVTFLYVFNIVLSVGLGTGDNEPAAP